MPKKDKAQAPLTPAVLHILLAVSAAVSVYSGKKLVFESQPVQVSALTEKRNATTSVFVEVPLKDLPAGEYTTQLTVLDQAGQKFAFSRAPLVVLER